MTLTSSKGIIFESHEDDKSTENQSFYLPVFLNSTIGAEVTKRVVVMTMSFLPTHACTGSIDYLELYYTLIILNFTTH